MMTILDEADFIAPELCDALVAACETRGFDPLAYSTRTGLAVDPTRHKGLAVRSPEASNEVLAAAAPFYEAAYRFNDARFKFDLFPTPFGFQVVKLTEGGFLSQHRDVSADAADARKLSVVVLLSNPADFEGGQLVFPRRVYHSGPKGSVVAFPNFFLHEVRPVTRGVRYSAVFWFSGPPWR